MVLIPRPVVWHLLFSLCCVAIIQEVYSEKRVVCYHTNWSIYRTGAAKFSAENIDPNLCTHLIYAFGNFSESNELIPLDEYADINLGEYSKFTGLKKSNKALKTMLAIGGWNEGSCRFSSLVANKEHAAQFIKNIPEFLHQYNFDGIDIDWSYPGSRTCGKSEDKENYVQFIELLREELNQKSSEYNQTSFLLTMTIPKEVSYIENGYDIPRLNKYLDWFNMPGYDYHNVFELFVYHHSPLYPLEEDSSDMSNINYTVKYLLQHGVDKDKLVLGIPTYSRSYTLLTEEDKNIGAPADGPGNKGDSTGERGYLAYFEVCQKIKNEDGWKVVQPNPNSMGPYAYRGTQWFGFDDENIVKKKAKYVVDNELGGIMFWTIGNDDFGGICHGKPYPIIQAGKEALTE